MRFLSVVSIYAICFHVIKPVLLQQTKYNSKMHGLKAKILLRRHNYTLSVNIIYQYCNV